MKKTFMTLLALGSVAFGEATLFTELGATDITIGNITYQTGKFGGLPFTDGVSVGSFTPSTDDGVICGTFNNKPTITVAFTLNLTKALQTTSQVDLIGISGDNSDVGLTLLGDGKAQGKWNAGTHGEARMTLSDLSDYAYTVGDESFVTLTLAASNSSNYSGRGVQVYVNDGTCVFNHSTLGTNNNTKFDAITINTGLISSIAIEPSLLETVGAGASSVKIAAVGKALQTAVVPEPATATLSLLALAGLAARRRRH